MKFHKCSGILLNHESPRRGHNFVTRKITIALGNIIKGIQDNYFSMLKSRLQKLDGLKYENLKENIQKVISEIPKEKYENIFKGAYERPEKYVPKNKTRKIKKNYK